MREALVQALTRMRYLLGVPSAVVLVALAFTDTLTALALEIMPGAWAQVLWTALLGVALVVTFQRWDSRRRQSLTSSNMGQPGAAKLAKRRGAVIMLGLEAATLEGSVARLLREAPALEWVAFVGTPQTLERNVSRKVREMLMPMAGLEVKASHIRSWEYANAESLAENEQSVHEAIGWMLEEGLTPADIILDITHGRRPMHLGAFLAAEAHSVEMQYLAPTWDHAANQSLKGQDAFKVVKEHYSEQEVGR